MESAASLSRYTVRLRDRREIAERTYAFRLEKPATFRFRPGQYVTLKLTAPSLEDPQGNARDLSIASAPHEDTIMVATRLRNSVFKRDLVDLPLNSTIGLEGPFGDFTMHNNASRPAVLLAGGIGITPFRSMIMNALREKLDHRIILFYSNHRPEDAPFLDEMQLLENENLKFRFIGTMTAMEKSSRTWNGERGRLSREMLLNHLLDVANPVFYIAGPPSLVGGVRELLVDIGIDSDNIRTEEFPGY